MATVTRYTAQITTVNQPLNQVGFVVKGDSQERQALVMTVPVAWRWPEPGETWLVKQENGTWYLDGVLPTDDYSDIPLGDAIVNSPTGVVHITGSSDGTTDFTFDASSFGGGGGAPSGPAGGDLTGTYPNPTIGSGKVTSAKIASGAASSNVGALGGDLSGTLPNPTVSTVGGHTPVTNVTSAGGDLTGTYPNPTVAASAITSTKIASGAAATNVGTLGGDLSGTLPNPTVAKVNGVTVTGTPSTGNVITATSGTAASWAPVPSGLGTSTVARAYRSSSQSFPASTGTLIPLNATSFDPGSNFDVTTNFRYNVPSTGYYQVNCATYLEVSATGTYTESALYIYKNGTAWSEFVTWPAVTNYIGLSVNDIIQCTAGDYLQMYAYCTQAPLVGFGPDTTYMSIVRVA